MATLFAPRVVASSGQIRHSRALSMHEAALGALHQVGSDADWMRLTDAGEQMLFEIARGRLKSGALVIDDFEHLPRLLDALKHRDFSGKPLIRIP